MARKKWEPVFPRDKREAFARAVYKRVLLALANLDISAAWSRIHGPKGSC